MNEVLGSVGPLLANHPVDVRPTPRLQALADPPRLRQILEHLVENAVKYAPPETTITIDWALVEGIVQLGVSDEGPGIPEEWRERIFEPYARRDTHTARGSGIGLYAAKRLGESMGARLWCEPARTARRPLRRRPPRRRGGLSQDREDHDHDEYPPTPDPCRR